MSRPSSDLVHGPRYGRESLKEDQFHWVVIFCIQFRDQKQDFQIVPTRRVFNLVLTRWRSQPIKSSLSKSSLIPISRHSLNAGNDSLEFATGSGNGFIERQNSPSPHGLVVETTFVTQNTSSIWVIYNQTDISNAQHVGLAMQVRPVRPDGSLRAVTFIKSSTFEFILQPGP